MKPFSYPTFEHFPPAASADKKAKYLAANTGMLYYISTTGTATYKPLWPNETRKDYQKPGIIGGYPKP